MDKLDVLVDFIKGLRIALNTASGYSKDHPFFVKAADDFKRKVDSTFLSLNPIKINVSPAALVIDDKTFDKGPVYTDMAYFFHLRKIKSVEIIPGVTTEELVSFLSVVSQPIKEILKQGGMDIIFRRAEASHIVVEPLDYSELLRGEGQEVKDLWSYLFAGAVKGGDPQKVIQFADNFEKIIEKFSAQDFLKSDELRQNLYSFMDYLKNNDPQRFRKCATLLIKVLLKDSSIANDSRLASLKIFFAGLDQDFFSDAIWQIIAETKEGHALDFRTFFALVDKITHGDIATALHKKIRDERLLLANPHAKKRIKELIITEENLMLEPIYKKSLMLLTEEGSGELAFDQAQISSCYHCVLLNLLDAETDKEKLGLISTRLSKDANALFSLENIDFLVLLSDVLRKKSGKEDSTGIIFKEFLKRLSLFAENSVFNMEDPQPVQPLIAKLSYSILGIDFYLNKVFEEEKINPHILRSMLKLFPQDFDLFLESLEKKKENINFLSEFISTAAAAGLPEAALMLKKIYQFSGNVVRMEVLLAMRNHGLTDEDLLFSVLKNDEITLQTEALKELMKDRESGRKALEAIFAQPKIQGLVIVQTLNLHEAKPYIVRWSKLWLPWHWEIRRKAREILRSWNE